jgi:hypothetical protein
MAGFLDRPGSSGAFGALLDEYARAADELCRIAESFEPERFVAERPSDDPDCVSPREICRHCAGAAIGYANYLLHARGIDMQKRDLRIEEPADVRPALESALRLTEETVEPLRDLDDQAVAAIEFRSRWGTVYNPESMLEHAICHLLRHRRQLESW